MILAGEEEQGSGRSFRRKAETVLNGLCDDEKGGPDYETGALIFDERTDRYDIRFDQTHPKVGLPTYYGGLHCGQCFDVMVGGRWKPTRIEFGNTWYLVGIRADDLNGLRVRI